jgi:hypothetical protein
MHGTDDTKDTPRGTNTGGLTGSVDIGPDEYTVKFQVRGATKAFVDSSHKHKSGQMNQPTTKDVVSTLVEDSDIKIEWLATDIKLDKVRFRDGATIWEELQRVGNENSYFIYQTRDGKLRVTDDTGRTTGDALILGENVLRFSAEQSEDEDRGEIKVKGQRTPKDTWGRDAVANTFKIVQNSASTNKAPVTLQHYGDATDEALERRANFEANKRVSASKSITIEVFHVQSNGAPWDVGNVHYVEIPPEGIYDAFECTGVDYDVNAKDTLKTTLTLAPLPSAGVGGGSTGFDINNLVPAISELVSFGLSRKALLGITVQPGQFPASWGSAELSIIEPAKSVYQKNKKNNTDLGLDDAEAVPLKLPPAFQENGGRGS